MLLGECIETSSYFASPSAISTQTSCTDLTTGVVFAVGPIDLESTVVKHVNHLMDHGIFLMLFGEEAVLTQQNAILWREAT
jgi:hypothetical protein